MKEYKVVENDDGSINHYDKNNNVIHYENSEGYEYWQEFDENNNLIHYKGSNGYEYWQEFDNNNLIYFKDSEGIEEYYIDKKLVTEEEFRTIYKQVWIKK